MGKFRGEYNLKRITDGKFSGMSVLLMGKFQHRIQIGNRVADRNFSGLNKNLDKVDDEKFSGLKTVLKQDC